MSYFRGIGGPHVGLWPTMSTFFFARRVCIHTYLMHEVHTTHSVVQRRALIRRPSPGWQYTGGGALAKQQAFYVFFGGLREPSKKGPRFFFSELDYNLGIFFVTQ